MDKLLCPWLHEKGYGRCWRTSKNKTQGNYLETMEVSKKRQWGLQKLGIGKDLARRTAYCGDRYYWVATKTCVVRAISKGILEKAGLISCLDYYNERHALKLCWTAVCRTARIGGVRGERKSPLLDPVQVRNPPGSGKDIVKDKSVEGDLESEDSWIWRTY